jgi:hypothetical protein
MPIYHQKLDFPVLPLDMCYRLVEYSKTAVNTGMLASSVYHHYDIPLETVEWLQSNLPVKGNYTYKIQRIFSINRIPNHIDLSRDNVANFLLSETGPETRWYADDYTSVIDSVVFNQYEWNLLKTDTMHSVEGMTSDRIALSVFEKLKQPKEPWFWET